MSFETEGILHKKYEIESKSSSFQTREFVITTEGTYPQYVKFQLTQDKCGVIDPCNEGEKVKVYFDLRGREWQGKYFTNLNAWKVEKVSGTNAEIQGAASMPNLPPVFEENQDMSSGLPADFDDLPF
jgi:single-strand DNA-binding protein